MAVQFVNNPKVGDNVKIEIGNSSDLQIYHDGTHSYVESISGATGDLYIKASSDDLVLQAADDVFIYTQGGEDAIIAKGNAAVELYHNNSKKFETTSSGVEVYGNVDLDSSTDLRLRFYDGVNFKAGIESVRSAGNMIGGSAVNDLAIRGQTNILFSTGGSTERMRITSTGNVGIGTTTATNKLTISDNSAQIALIDTSTSNIGEIQVGDADFTFNLDRQAAISSGKFAWRIDDTTRMELGLDSGDLGQLRLNEYGSGNITGTATFLLGVDENGYIIEESTSGGGTVTGSGAATRVAFWSGTSALSSDANLYWDNTNDRLGIGTTSPTSPLTIKSSSTSSSSSGLTIQANGNTNDIFQLGEKSTDGSRFQMLDAGVVKIALYSDGTDNYINAGNVGIGTTSPDAKLDIQGDGADFFLQSADHKIARIQPRGTGANLDKGLFSLFNGSTESVRIDTDGNSWLNGGNVGIGTTSPGNKLHVNSGSTSDIVKFENNNGSMVFGQTTALTSLDLASSNAYRIRQGSSTPFKIETSGAVTFDNVISGVRASFVSTLQDATVLSAEGAYSSSGSVKLFEAKRSGSAVAGNWSYDDATTDMSLGTSTAHSFSLKTGNTRALTIDSSQKSTFAADLVIPNAIIHAGDTNTYIQFHNTDEFRVVVAGNERFEVTNSQTTVQNQLTINGDVLVKDATPVIIIRDSNATTPSNTIAYVSMQESDGTEVAFMGMGSGSNSHLYLSGSAGTDVIIRTDGTTAMFIDTNQRVGVGTTSPSYKFTVNDSTANGRGIQVVQSATSGTNYGIQGGAYGSGATKNIGLSITAEGATTNDAAHFLGGNVGIGTTSPVTSLDVRGEVSVAYNASYGLRFYNNARNNWSSIGNNVASGTAANLVFKDSTGEVMRITGGNLGIGTTAPTGKLEVQRSQVTTQFDRDCFLRLHPTATTDEGGLTNIFFGTSTTNNFGVAVGGRKGGAGDTSSTNNPEFSVRILNDAITGTEVLNINTAGNATFAGDVSLADTKKLKFGAGDDLEIYHDGNNSKITEGGTGGLYIGSSLLGIQNGSHNETMATFTADGSVDLYYNNSKKFETASNGVDITGHLSTTLSLIVGEGINSTSANIEIGKSRTASGYAYIDFVGDTTYTDYGLRIIRGNQGANTNSDIIHRGTGTLQLKTQDAADILFSTSSTERMRITSGGNVGIGTTNASMPLHVSRGGTTAATIGIGQTGTAVARLYIDASNGDFSGGDYMWMGQNNDLSGEIVMTQNSGAFHIKTQPSGTITSQLTVLQDGKVGISTTSPAEKLTVSGNANITGKFAVGIANAHPSLDFYNQGTAYFNGSTTVDDNLIVTNGRLGLGTTAPSSLLHLSDASSPTIRIVDTTNSVTLLAFAQDSSAGFGTYSNHTLAFFSNSAERMRISTGGNVGIGTTSPSAKLHVNGTAKATKLELDESGSSTGDLSSAAGFIDVIVGGTGYIIPYFSPD